jgi:glycosyltransferase involved in cell wall biosynthesis
MSKYSIILPVRNGGEYIKQCVYSVLAQKHADFNFLILDNASSDGTLEWLQSLNDERIKIYPSNNSLSIEQNWARVVEVPKNEYISLIGHDDILYPDFLKTIDDLIQSNPSASLFHTHFNFIDADGNILRSCKPMKSSYNGSEFLEAFMNSTIDSMGTGYVMRSKDYDAVNGIPLKYPGLLFADFELWVKLANINRVIISNNSLFAFRVHQSATSKSLDGNLHTALKIFVSFLSDLIKKDEKMKLVISQSGATFLLNYCKSYSHRLLRTDLKKREGLTVTNFINESNFLARKLEVEENYHPDKMFSIRLAKIIDNYSLFRNIFLLIKRIYPKPF